MEQRRFLIRLILIIFFIFILNYLAMEFYWYTSMWYLDMIMHFLGGFWIGLSSIYFLSIKDLSRNNILKVLLLVFFIGIGWEIFEIQVSNFITNNSFNVLDTLSDLFFDISGGIFSFLYFSKKIMLINENKL